MRIVPYRVWSLPILLLNWPQSQYRRMGGEADTIYQRLTVRKSARGLTMQQTLSCSLTEDVIMKWFFALTALAASNHPAYDVVWFFPYFYPCRHPISEGPIKFPPPVAGTRSRQPCPKAYLKTRLRDLEANHSSPVTEIKICEMIPSAIFLRYVVLRTSQFKQKLK